MVLLGIRSLQPCPSHSPCSPRNRFQLRSSTRNSLLKTLCLPDAACNKEGSKVDVFSQPEKTSERKKKSEDSCEDLKKRVSKIKEMLQSMDDGGISISAYATSWVALVPKLDGTDGPQFPSCLKWIEENLLPDGSWGDSELFNAYDRLLSTLACVVALKSWGMSPDQCRRGISFLSAGMKRLDDEDLELMPSGFELTFTSLLERARSMDLHIPLNSPGLEKIRARKFLKLKRIPKDILYQAPTTLLLSLEGMESLQWEKIMRFQCADGSFLSSTSSTAFALMCTGDVKCLDYLQKIVHKYDGGVPFAYPMDFFQRLWVVDRLERLGISRYFGEEIRPCLDYVYSFWTSDGISWSRFSNVPDMDDTAMGFRLLRLHGYDVTPDALRHFEKDGQFFCLPGQMSQGVSDMYNLYRAAHLAYPGEELLLAARRFSREYLQQRTALNKLSDRWIISKDLPGEIGYGMEFPWHASLPRVETRFYLDQYGGGSDAWVSNTLYRVPCVSNDEFLKLARLDFCRCQSLHKHEWLGLVRWFEESGISGLGVSKKNLQGAYFIAAASIFEPERAAERLGWARTAALADAISHLTSGGGDSAATSVLEELSPLLSASSSSLRKGDGFLSCLLRMLDLLAQDSSPSLTTRGQIRRHLCRAWEDWIQAQRRKEDDTGLLLVRSLELCAGRSDLEESLLFSSQAQHCHSRLAESITSLSRRLRPLRATKGNGQYAAGEVDAEMQELVMLVLSNSTLDGSRTLHTFLTVARSLYYAAICSPAAFRLHADKVLFREADVEE